MAVPYARCLFLASTSAHCPMDGVPIGEGGIARKAFVREASGTCGRGGLTYGTILSRKGLSQNPDPISGD
jgi:hypothetical protein